MTVRSVVVHDTRVTAAQEYVNGVIGAPTDDATAARQALTDLRTMALRFGRVERLGTPTPRYAHG